MQRVSAHVLATVLSSLVFFGLSNLAVYASFDPHPNPNNRGHHYGWAKHNHAPAPPPAPNPAPAPPPAPAPGGSAAHASGVIAPAHSNGSHPAVGFARGVPQLDLPVLKLVPTRQTADANVGLIAPPVGGDPWWWLVLLLPPTLAALWAIAFRRVIGGRPSASGGPATATA